MEEGGPVLLGTLPGSRHKAIVQECFEEQSENFQAGGH